MRLKSLLGMGHSLPRLVRFFPRSTYSTILGKTLSVPNPDNNVLDITHDFEDDNGQHFDGALSDTLNPGAPSSTSVADRNWKAFNAALNMSGTVAGKIFNEIKIPAGRYVFDKPLIMSNTAIKKTIRGDANPQTFSFPDVGSLEYPSTVLDFSLFPRQPIQDFCISFSGATQKYTFSDPNPEAAAGTQADMYWPPERVENGTTSEISSPHFCRYTITSSYMPQADDLLILIDQHNWSYGPRYYYYAGEFLKVNSVASDGKTIEIFPLAKYGPRCDIFKITPIKFHLSNITIVEQREKRGEPYVDSNGVNQIRMKQGVGAGLKINYATNSCIENVHIIDASYNVGLSLGNCYDLQIQGGKYIIAPPNGTRVLRNAGYSTYGPLDHDAYSISIGSSQNILVDKVDARSWSHTVATGGGANDTLWIVNRNIIISNSQLTATHAPLYSGNDPNDPNYGKVVAKLKIAAANFHGNTEYSTYINNTLIGAGFNIGGHKNSFFNNVIRTNNFDEAKPSSDLANLGDSVFYFDEAKSADFRIEGNKVFIEGFYQLDIEPTTISNFRFGEFLHFQVGGVVGRYEINKQYQYVFSKTLYTGGELCIFNNEVQIQCGANSNSTVCASGFITIVGMPIQAKDVYNLCTSTPANLPTEIEVVVVNNRFSVYNNNNLSKSISLIGVNSKKDGHALPAHPDYFTRIKKINISANRFYGFFRISVNKSDVFNNTSSAAINITDNEIIYDKNAITPTPIDCEKPTIAQGANVNNTLNVY